MAVIKESDNYGRNNKKDQLKALGYSEEAIDAVRDAKVRGKSKKKFKELLAVVPCLARSAIFKFTVLYAGVSFLT